MTDPLFVNPKRFLEIAREGDVLHRYSPLGECCVLLDLAGEHGLAQDQLRALEAFLPQLACPIIGVNAADPDSRLAVACDTLAVSLSEAQLLRDNCLRNPVAAMTLVQLLRVSLSLPPVAALAMESLAYATLQRGEEFQRWLNGRAGRERRVEQNGDPLIVQRDNETLLLELNRPASRNEITVSLRDALVDALQLVVSDVAIQQVILRGAGKCFSVGGALHEFGSVSDPASAHVIRSVQLPAKYLIRCAERVEARVHSACIGAGIEIPAFAARVVAAPSAFFQLPELSMGLIPGAGGCVSIPRRIGRQRSVWLMLSGRRVNAETALAWGLVDAIDGDLF